MIARWTAAAAAAALLLALDQAPHPQPVLAAAPPSPCPSASPSASPSPTPTPGSPQALCAQQQQLQRLHASLDADLVAAKAAQQQLHDALDKNASQTAQLQGRLAVERAEVARLESEIDQLSRRIEALKQRIAAEQAQIGALARSMYVRRQPLIVRLAASGGLRQLLLTAGGWTAAVGSARRLRAKLELDRADLLAQRQELSDEQSKHAAAVTRLEADIEALRRLGLEQEAALAQLQGQIQRIDRQRSALDDQNAKLAAEITARLQADQTRIIGDAMRQVWAQVALWLAANSPPGAPHPGGRLIWPEPAAVITQPFGPSDLWLEPAWGGYPHFHLGLDLAEPEGSPVLAAADGKVALVGAGTTGYGNFVVIAHAGGMTTLYGHLAAAAVQVGDPVLAGQPIGLEGSTGASTGPHLHFEVRIDGQPVDPAAILPPGPAPARA